LNFNIILSIPTKQLTGILIGVDYMGFDEQNGLGMIEQVAVSCPLSSLGC
jgi:hypothetical protein